MKILLLGLLVIACSCREMAVTKEYVAYLKATVSWEVEEYEDNIFRGWTMEEAKTLFGLKPLDQPSGLPQQPEPTVPLPSEFSWKADACDHKPQNQANCGSCWAFAAVGMLSSRCCLHTEDKGWLSPQELVSCDRRDNGCNGGSPRYAAEYAIEMGGIVPDACFTYKAKAVPCPRTCEDKKNWENSHACRCHGITECKGVKSMKGCLQTGPISVGFGVCESFLNYKSGIYACDCQGQYKGYHAVLLQGYSDTPKCHWIIRNSWGETWGEKGYFKIECDSCGIDGRLSGANIMCNKVA